MRKILFILPILFVLSGCGAEELNQHSTSPDDDVVLDKDLNDVSVDTSEWTTYVNEEYGFSVQHPNDWSVGGDYPLVQDTDYVAMASPVNQGGPEPDIIFKGGSDLLGGGCGNRCD